MIFINSQCTPSLNPVSLVNMVMNVGIAVEFSSHLVQAYSLAADDFPDRLERARYALNLSLSEDSARLRICVFRHVTREMGPVLLSGVHMTNLIGVAILGFAQTQIFFIYYFQVNNVL